MDLFASPFWVNLFLLIPLAMWFYFKKNKLDIIIIQLLFAVIFGMAFGFVESSVVIYLRATVRVLPGFQGSLFDIQQQALHYVYHQQLILEKLPASLVTVETIREASTIIVILIFALVGARKLKERIALFLLAFASWDFFYYVFLYVTVGWPQSLRTKDILFLIPQPWYSEVWFPILIDILVGIIIFTAGSSSKTRA